MFCLGTLINTGAVIAGGLLGITVTCSHHLISDFEVEASCSMALQSQVSTSYPRASRDFY